MVSRCTHVGILGDCSQEDIYKKQKVSTCNSCTVTGPNLWACLHYDCQYIGCEEMAVDHSTRHFKENPEHCLTLNLTSLRVWCYLCETEVFLGNNVPPVRGVPPRSHVQHNVSVANADPDSDDENLDEDHNLKPRGLTGLQNIGNTCYMNAALQALSNCPPLTQFFLDCGAYVRNDRKPGLAKSYLKLMTEIWHKKRPSYVVPSNISYGIKLVCPMFRGYTQQDSQEFLRCFMDQLHEELKVTLTEIPDSQDQVGSPAEEMEIRMDTQDSGEESSVSEGEYETCDSGLSSEKSSCGEEAVNYMDQVPHFQKETTALLNHGSGGVAKVASRKKIFHNHRGGMGGNRDIMNNAVDFQSHRMRESSFADSGSGKDGIGEGECLAELKDSVSDAVPVSVSTATYSRPSSPAVSLPDMYPKQSLGGLSASATHIKSTVHYPTLNSTKFYSQATITQPSPVTSTKSSRKRKLTKYRSIISDVFDGKILSSVQCLTCDRVSSTKETFQDLSLPIPNREYLGVLHASQSNASKGTMSTCTDVYSNQGWLSWMVDWMKSWFWGPTVSLQDCLAAFFSADELKGDNMYSCEKCKKLRNGIKYSKVLYLPEILCIHLKRFRHEVMFSSKISSYVSFPLEGLDMQPFLHKDCPSNVSTYDLVAVICHHGTAGGGHYTSYALNCINDQWYEFDDQYVTEVDPHVVANCEAYVLFYRKASELMMKKRQRAVELMEISKREPSLMQFYISKQWVNKFNTFAEPGPIDNTDFLCHHGGVRPKVQDHVNELCTVLSQGVWEYLHGSFQGGPPCTRLYLCRICQQELESLENRRKQELDQFCHLQRDSKNRDSTNVLYVISMSWFRSWENFVKGKDDDPPGPIDNSIISANKNGQIVLKTGSDYAPLSEELWMFLHSIYGGGPQLTLRPSCMSINSQMASNCETSCHATSAAAAPTSSLNTSVTSGIASATSSSYSSQTSLTGPRTAAVTPVANTVPATTTIMLPAPTQHAVPDEVKSLFAQPAVVKDRVKTQPAGHSDGMEIHSAGSSDQMEIQSVAPNDPMEIQSVAPNDPMETQPSGPRDRVSLDPTVVATTSENGDRRMQDCTGQACNSIVEGGEPTTCTSYE